MYYESPFRVLCIFYFIFNATDKRPFIVIAFKKFKYSFLFLIMYLCMELCT